jgi:hypothetical protein
MEKRTKENPWKLLTPPGSSSYEMWIAENKEGMEIVHCQVGSTLLHYDYRIIADIHAMLKEHGDWIPLGSKDEKPDTKEGTIQHWGRSVNNPIGGWYGLRKGYRGRVGMYLPPLMEALGLVELEHNARNNRMRAL